MDEPALPKAKGSPMKRSRHISHGHGRKGKQIRLLIPARAAGRIIGPAGKNVNSLRKQFDVSIKIPDSPGPERVLKIVGENEEGLHSALNEILKTLNDCSPRPEDFGYYARLIFPNQAVGIILGIGGEKLRELRSVSQAKIKVFQKFCPNSTDRIVALRGDPMLVHSTIKTILELTDQVPIDDTQIEYNPADFWNTVPLPYGGFQVESPADYYFGHQQRTPLIPPAHSNVTSDRNRGHSHRNFGNDRNGAQKDHYRRYHSVCYYPSNRGRGRRQISSVEREPKNTELEVVQYTVPKKYAGAIIGTHGSTIEKFRRESGASVEISDPSAPNADPNADRVVTLRGTKAEIKHATYLLQQCAKVQKQLIG